MKGSFTFGTLLPTALALGAFMACAHANSGSVQRPAPRVDAALTAEDIERAPSVPIEQLLAARVAGITLTQARDGRLMIQIRGQTTLLGDQEPLFVVNGIPLGRAESFAAINRHDIATIEVVKDAAGTALYGLRGANGVIAFGPRARGANARRGGTSAPCGP
jgi:TonB-dependent SusC/RagA subfamily outer membrane receptor